MELHRDIHEMFKPSFLKYSIHFKMPLDIPLWKTNTGQKKLFFFEPKILPKINPRGCSRIPTHSHLVRKRTLKKISRLLRARRSLKFLANTECKFTLKRTRDMIRTSGQINPSNKNVKQRLLSCTL